jgi:formamidopyrimidine-DNA glycosylase
MATKLPSGREIKHISDSKETKSTQPADNDQMESTAGAMSIDIEGQCPKCKSMMGNATASGESVYYCESCRVSMPLPVTN